MKKNREFSNKKVLQQMLEDLNKADPMWIETIQGAKKDNQTIMYEFNPNPNKSNHFFAQMWYASLMGVDVFLMKKGKHEKPVRPDAN